MKYKKETVILRREGMERAGWAFQTEEIISGKAQRHEKHDMCQVLLAVFVFSGSRS